MPYSAILRQAHTPEDALSTAKEELRRAHRMRPEESLPEWVAFPHGIKPEELFLQAADFLAKQLEDASDLTVLVDEVHAQRLNPMAQQGWSSLIASLILAFPEIRWHFLVVTGRPEQATEKSDAPAKPPKDLTDREKKREEEEVRRQAEEERRWQELHKRHGAASLTADRGSALFDGHGLRQFIRDLMDAHARERGSEREREIGNLPHRRELATVLDDETGFVLFEAFAAYRNGYRAHAIASWGEAEYLLGPQGLLTKASDKLGSNAAPGTERVAAEETVLSIEDFFLSYPDKRTSGVSDLEARERLFPVLGKSSPPIRRFVTVGHERQPSAVRKRDADLKQLRISEQETTGRRPLLRNQVVLKPISGLYTLWGKIGMYRALRKNRHVPADDPLYRHDNGLARGYVWPPEYSQDHFMDSTSDEDGHSSPGRLLQIAEHLIQRANDLLPNTHSVDDAVRGAVLATQALELLGGKTPTVSVDALALKHEFEVIAESHFVGVEFHLSMKERLADIRKNLEAMKKWLCKERQAAFLINSEARIIKRLIAVLDRYDEFEESVVCQNRLRFLHFCVECHDAREKPNLFSLLKLPAMYYFVFGVRSVGHLLALLAGTVALFAFAFAVAGDPQAWTSSINAVLGRGNVPEGDTTRLVIYYAATLAGLCNFGFFINLIYARISRH